LEIHPSLWTKLLAGFLNKDAHDLAMWDHVVASGIVFIFLVLLAVVVRANLKLVPGKLQQAVEVVIEALNNMMEGTIGPGGKKYLPLIGTLAFFIFVSNFFGMLPTMSAATGNANTTIACSLIVFIYYNYEGFRAHGAGYVKHFMGPLLWLAPFMFLIEAVGHLARPLSLGVRLFGNVSGEHIASATFYDLFAYIVPMPLMAFGLFAATLQTFIFIMLTSVYLAGAVSHAH
jgi:F-type H+-transporting ATPase subunit a